MGRDITGTPPPTLGDCIDRAKTLADLVPLMSAAARMDDAAQGHRYADEIAVKALRLVVTDRDSRPALLRLTRAFEAMDKFYDPPR